MLAAAKNKKNIECPWCCVCVCFEFNSPCEVSLKEIRQAQCPACGENVVELRKVMRTLEPRSFGGGYEKKEQRDEWVVIWPQVRNTCSNEQIPSEIRNDLNNALSILDITPDAAASLARRALERTLRKYLNLKGRNLEDLILAAKDHLYPRIYKLLDAIRGYGNFGAHLKEDFQNGELLLVERDEAFFTIQATKELAEDWFIHKSRTDTMLNQIDVKKERSKKA